MMTTPGSAELRSGGARGLACGLLLGAPAAIVVKASDYDNDGLAVLLVVLGGAYVVVLGVAAALLLRGRRALAVGLALGATMGFAVAPAFVLLDIAFHSA